MFNHSLSLSRYSSGNPPHRNTPRKANRISIASTNANVNSTLHSSHLSIPSLNSLPTTRSIPDLKKAVLREKKYFAWIDALFCVGFCMSIYSSDFFFREKFQNSIRDLPPVAKVNQEVKKKVWQVETPPPAPSIDVTNDSSHHSIAKSSFSSSINKNISNKRLKFNLFMNFSSLKTLVFVY